MEVATSEYLLAKTAAGVADRSNRGRLLLTGADVADFLQGQVSNDVDTLAPGRGCYATLLTAKGKIRCDMRILRGDDWFLLDSEPQALPVLEHMVRVYSIGLDVRSPGEYTGELLHMPDYPQEGAMRGGHIPGAKSVPWARAANEDGTFKSRADLESIYQQEQGLSPDRPTIAYCRIGERSSHTWFVLTHLLGYGDVRNYDGSWTEWGNAVRVPVER